MSKQERGRLAILRRCEKENLADDEVEIRNIRASTNAPSVVATCTTNRNGESVGARFNHDFGGSKPMQLFAAVQGKAERTDGMRCTTYTQLPVAFCGGINAKTDPLAGLMLSMCPCNTSGPTFLEAAPALAIGCVVLDIFLLALVVIPRQLKAWRIRLPDTRKAIQIATIPN
jgi:hypothetical protein